MEQVTQVLIATVCIALGLSFAYKFVNAAFFGKSVYWTGFLPIGIISPFFIHWPPGKKSLIKTVQGTWIHITLGPAFFLCSMLFLSSGADQLGLPGSEMVNTVLTLGRPGVPAAITYSKERGYNFPIAGRMAEAIKKLVTAPMSKEKGGFAGQTVGGQQVRK